MKTSADDELVLVLLAALAAPLVLSGLFPAAAAWLIAHRFLVTADQALVQIPGAGAGLDARRIVVLAAVVTALLAAALWTRRGRSTQKQP